MFRLVLFFILLVLPGCVFMPNPFDAEVKEQTLWSNSGEEFSILPAPAETVFVGTETVYQRNYTLNQHMSVKTGEPVLRVQAFKKQNYITNKLVLDKKLQVGTKFEKMTFPPGEYAISGIIELDNVPYFILASDRNIHLMADMNGILQRSIIYDIRDSDKVQVLNDKVRYSVENPKLTRRTSSYESKVPFIDFEIVYDGIKNDQISLFHKYAVPGTNGEKGAFDTYTYPKDATMISVEGTLIRIIRADKEHLEFIVLKNP